VVTRKSTTPAGRDKGERPARPRARSHTLAPPHLGEAASAAVLAVAVWTFLTGRCRVALLVLVLAFVFNPAIEWALKAGVDRVRPSLLPLGPGRGPSFPSGHVLASVGFYGLLPVLAPVFGSPSRARIVAAMVGVAALVVTLAFDLPDVTASGVTTDLEVGDAEPAAGFWMELVGAVVLTAGAALLAALLHPRRGRPGTTR